MAEAPDPEKLNFELEMFLPADVDLVEELERGLEFVRSLGSHG
jgi:hypothetical protein